VLDSISKLPRGSWLIVLLALGSIQVSCTRQPPEEQATLVISGARVWTGNPAQPWAEAVAAQGDHILAVGSADQVMRLVGPQTRIIQANGGMLVPGFIDTHVHFTAGGAGLASVQLRCRHGRNLSSGSLTTRPAWNLVNGLSREPGITRIGAVNYRPGNG